jgi:type I restriction enzyme S subunit
MSSEWKEHSLSHLCELIADCPHATPKWTVDGIIVLRNQNIKNGRLDLSEPSYTDEEHYLGRIRRANPQAGDLVITREAPMGEVCQIPEGLKSCLGQRQVLLRADAQKIDRKFLLYALQSPYLQHQIGWNEGTGSTVSNLRIPVLQALKVPTPSLSMQQQIAEILSSLDDRISLLRETNATLESIAQAIFKSWFIDFDPVKAKQQGVEPQGIDAATAALFPDAFQDSELGPIPAGWEVLPLGELVRSVGGGTPSTKDISYWEPAEFAWTTPKDLSAQDSPVLLKTERMISEKGAEKISSGLLPKGTLLLSSRAPIGYLAIAGIPLCINQGYIAMLPGSVLPPLYMLFWCKSNMELIKSRSNGSTFMEISKKSFRGILVIKPTDVLLKCFTDLITPAFDRMVENENKIQTLASIRDTLLPRLISGRLRLPEAEAMAGEAGL